MASPKVIVFDLGKVLVDFDYGIAARRIAAQGKIVPDQIRAFIDQSPLLFQLESGQLSVDRFFEEVRRATGFSGSFDEFASFFADIFVPIESMIQLHSNLRQRGFATYIFSNTNDLAIRHIRKRFPFFTLFEGYILSYQHGAMKPDAKLYEVVERESGRHRDEILYIDDRPENISAGEARGWQVILHEAPDKTRLSIEKLGLLERAPAAGNSTVR
jgi:HAD superfamily hydrolase (TIGR01509 family)